MVSDGVRILSLDTGAVTFGVIAESRVLASAAGALKQRTEATPVQAPRQVPPRPEPGERSGSSLPLKRLSFTFYGEQGTPSLRIYDARTGELIKTIPPDLVGPGQPAGALAPGLDTKA